MVKNKTYLAIIAFPEEKDAKRFIEKSNIKGHVLREDKLKIGGRK